MTSAAPTSLAEATAPLLEAFERALDTAIRSRGLPLNLEEAMRYAAGGGGKRLRPLLTLLSARAAGGSAVDSMPAAIAVELVHSFSLVHDDLPSMDDDDMRRGRPTLHVQAGETMAVLAGDALSAFAFEVLGDCPLRANVRIGLVTELANATNAMIAGQVYDTIGGFAQELDASQRLTLVHRNKTGALFRAACRLGALAVEADDEALTAISAYGAAVGHMFQIVDDLIDVEQDPEHAGKATGKDAAKGKLTYPAVHGVEASREVVARLLTEAVDAVAPLGEAAEPLATLAREMAARTR